MIAQTTFNKLIVQLAHVYSSFAIMFMTAFYSEGSKKAVYIACGCIIVGSAIKEAFIDPRTETVQEQGNGWVDFGVQAGSALIALFLILISLR